MELDASLSWSRWPWRWNRGASYRLVCCANLAPPTTSSVLLQLNCVHAACQRKLP